MAKKYWWHIHAIWEFVGTSRWLSGKESACNAGNKDSSLIPGLRRSPWKGNGNPFQHSYLQNPMDTADWLQFMGLQRVGHDLTAKQQHCAKYYTIVLRYIIKPGLHQLPLCWGLLSLFYKKEIKNMNLNLPQVFRQYLTEWTLSSELSNSPNLSSFHF